MAYKGIMRPIYLCRRRPSATVIVAVVALCLALGAVLAEFWR
jgi:hypothetical protein